MLVNDVTGHAWRVPLIFRKTTVHGTRLVQVNSGVTRAFKDLHARSFKSNSRFDEDP